jgi:AraC family transcriptional activator FtrA
MTSALAHRDQRTVAILAYNGLCTFEFGIATEIFALPRPEFEFDWYRHRIVAVDNGPMFALGGLQVHADTDLTSLADFHTIIIPGWRNRAETPPPDLVTALRAAHANGARLLSICSGVFVLAATGLLDGCRATTHWRYCAELAQRFPAIHVDANVLYVDEEQLITSAGSAAGIDACLHLVTRDFGAAVANQVARRLVMSPQRQGGQAQFIPAPLARHRHQDFAELMQWLLQRLQEPISTAAMADFMAMSERNFSRKFVDVVGITPKAWLQYERLQRARQLLETSDTTLDVIAMQCGFASTETFRSAFRQQLGISPSTYREQYSER